MSARLIFLLLLTITSITVLPRVEAKSDSSGQIKHLIDNGRTAAARAQIKALLKQNPHCAGAFAERGRLYIEEDKIDRAIADCTTALKIDPRYVDAYIYRSVAYRHVGDNAGVIANLNEAIKLRPADADLFLRRSEAQADVGRFGEALADAEAAVALRPKFADGYDFIATAREGLGQFDQAAKARSQALRYDPANSLQWLSRARDYQWLGKADLARADRRRAATLLAPGDLASVQACYPMADLGYPGTVDVLADIEKRLAKQPVVLPFHYDDGAHFYVPVEINGHKLNMMVDTGCGHSDIWEFALPGVGKAESVRGHNYLASGKDFSFGVFRAKNLKLGSLDLTDTMLEIHKGLVDQKLVHGFLGCNIMENFVTTVDYETKTLSLSSAPLRPQSKNAIVLPMVLGHHCPHCYVKLDNQVEVLALVDTGCPYSLAANTLLKPILPGGMTYSERVSGPWLGRMRGQTVKLKSLTIGGQSYPGPLFDVFVAADGPMASSVIVLGNDFLSGFRSVTFDYRQKQIVLEPQRPDFKSAPASFIEGQYRLKRGQYQKVIDIQGETIKLDPEFTVAALGDRIEASLRVANTDQALPDLAELVRQRPHEMWVYQYRAYAYGLKKNYKLAIIDDTEAIRLEPTNISCYKHRAWAYRCSGRWKEAQADNQTIARLSRKSQSTRH